MKKIEEIKELIKEIFNDFSQKLGVKINEKDLPEIKTSKELKNIVASNAAIIKTSKELKNIIASNAAAIYDPIKNTIIIKESYLESYSQNENYKNEIKQILAHECVHYIRTRGGIYHYKDSFTQPIAHKAEEALAEFVSFVYSNEPKEKIIRNIEA